MGMTPIQRYRIRQYLKRIQSQREYKAMLKRRQKIFSWIKPILKVGFWFFLFKGLLWLLLLYYGVSIL
jgi:hypothetical protein